MEKELDQMERELDSIEKAIALIRKEIRRRRWEEYPEALRQYLRSMGGDPNGDGIERRIITITIESE